MKVEASIPAITIAPQEGLSSNDLEPADGVGPAADRPTKHSAPRKSPLPRQLHTVIHKHTFFVVAATVLVVGSSAIVLGANYWTAKNIPLSADTSNVRTGAKPVSGFNMTVSAADFQTKMQQITGQPVTLTVGPYSEKVSGDTIRGWLQISANQQKTEYYIHVNEAAIGNSLVKKASEYARAPVNQLTVTEDGTSVVAVGGKNGRALSDLEGLKAQGKAAAKNVLASKGLQFNTPLVTQPFQSVTPANYGKLIVADITTKKMWAFQNGQQVNTWLTSDGKPSTPTPVGSFKIYAKFSSQDMRGNNPDGSTYFQPHVHWVNYFYEGSAIHGVYWHPLSWFGAINSSHGCIGVPDSQAEWIYNWAPIGTPVIVHV